MKIIQDRLTVVSYNHLDILFGQKHRRVSRRWDQGNGVRRVCQEGRGGGGDGLEREGCTLGFNPDWDGTPIQVCAAHQQDMLFASLTLETGNRIPDYGILSQT